jgi:hypothetical protein
VILLLDGAFGIGKTTVARLVVARLPRAVLFDPELIGIALQRVVRVDDFQDLRAWRRLTVASLRATRLLWPNIVVPMAFSNAQYLREISDGIRRFEPRVHHVCLTAPLDVVNERLRGRGAEPWAYRRAAECCIAHRQSAFDVRLPTEGRTPEAVAAEVLRGLE